MYRIADDKILPVDLVCSVNESPDFSAMRDLVASPISRIIYYYGALIFLHTGRALTLLYHYSFLDPAAVLSLRLACRMRCLS